MMNLTIEQLKFAREIGATHWDCETFRYRKDGYIYLYITGYWADGITGDSYYDYDDIIKIDFAPLDDYYTDKELDIVAAGGDTELEVARIITVPQDALVSALDNLTRAYRTLGGLDVAFDSELLVAEALLSKIGVNK